MLLPCYSNASSLKHESTMVQIDAFERDLANLFKDIGRYPSSTEGLISLTNKPHLVSSWKGPYINKPTVPLDHWGNEYRYLFPSKYGDKNFDLYSYGKNKVDDHGQADDITNWKNISAKHYYPVRWAMQFALYLIAITALFFCLWKIASRFMRGI